MKKNELLKLTKEDLCNKIVCFPTDTVYGVGCLMNDEVGVNKIYALKHRDKNKPLAILAYNIEQILPYIEKPSEEVMALMKKYWPGALTIIFNKNKTCKNIINQEFQTIGFRIPNSKIALDILQKFGVMATTSINLSGSAPLNNLNLIKQEFGNEIDYLIEDLEVTSNVSSTVIDATQKPFKVLREGNIKIDV